MVNLVLKNKGTPPISKRVVEMVGMEEVTLLLGRRGKGDDGRLVEVRKGDEKKGEEARPQLQVLQVREKEEVNLELNRKAGGLHDRRHKLLPIIEDNEVEVEEVNLALSTGTPFKANLEPEVVEEVTLSLSAEISQLEKEWTVENVNKYGSVLMVCN